MAVTKTEIRDDLILRFTQGKPSSDFEVPNAQIDRWIDISRDRFLADLLFKTGKYDGFYIDPTYVTIERELALTVSTTVDTDEGEFKCTVANPILSTPLNDYGLVRVRTKILASPYTHTTCNKVDRRTLADIKAMEFSTPTATNPVVYRDGQDLYFSGLVADSDTASGEAAAKNVTVEYVEAMVGSSTDYSISEAHVADITEMAEEIGKRELGIMIVDPVNDGDQNAPAQPQQQTRR